MSHTRQKIEPSFASFKFTLLETLNADPEMTGAHLKVMLPYLKFCDGASKAVFVAMSDLRRRTGLAESSIRKARNELLSAGYLQPTGQNADCGAPLFRIVNARFAEVTDIQHGIVRLLQEDAAKKKARYRANKAKKAAEAEALPPSATEDAMSPAIAVDPPSNVPREIEAMSPSAIEGKYVSRNTTVTSMNEREPQRERSERESSQERGWEGAFPIPSSNEEAQALITAVIKGRSVLPHKVQSLQRALWRGVLTATLAEQIINITGEAGNGKEEDHKANRRTA